MPSALRDEIERAAWFLGSRAHFFGVSFSLRALAQYSYFRIVISLSSNGMVADVCSNKKNAFL
jgi:hypothetical protein